MTRGAFRPSGEACTPPRAPELPSSTAGTLCDKAARHGGPSGCTGKRPVPAFTPLPERQHLFDELVVYVPLALAARYARDGWTVRRMVGHHAGHSALASRWVAKGGTEAQAECR